jgi:hypothetical protein
MSTNQQMASATAAVMKATAALDELRKTELKLREDLRQEPANVELIEALTSGHSRDRRRTVTTQARYRAALGGDA